MYICILCTIGINSSLYYRSLYFLNSISALVIGFKVGILYSLRMVNIFAERSQGGVFNIFVF